MQVDFQHGVYRSHPVFFGDILSDLDAQTYASMQASLDAFYNSLRQASADQREALVQSAIAGLRASAGRGADAVYNQAKASGASETDAKAAAQRMVAAYRDQEAAYLKASTDIASQEDATRSATISSQASKARSLLNQAYGLSSEAPAAPASHTLLFTLLAAGAAYLALKG